MDHFFIVYVVNRFVYKNQHIIQEISFFARRAMTWVKFGRVALSHDRDKIKTIKQID